MDVLISDSPVAARVLNLFATEMNKSNALQIPRISISKRLGVSLSSVDRAIRYLHENRYLDVLRSGRANTYVMNSEVVWTDKAWGRKEAEIFNCKVIMDWDDQYWGDD